MLRIDRFVWTDERIEHIARHGVTPAEVEEVWDAEGTSELSQASEAMKKSKLPKFDSIQKLAEFWDTHDFTGFQDEMVEVREPVGAASNSVSVPLDQHEAKALDQLARAKGMSREELIRSWVRQKITRRNSSQRTKRSA